MKKLRNKVFIDRKTIRKMTRTSLFSMFFFILALNCVAIDAYSQTVRMNMKATNLSLKDAILEVKRQTEFDFLYSKDIEPLYKPTAYVSIENGTVDEALAQLFKNSNIAYQIVNKTIVLTSAKTKTKKMVQQGPTITGRVTDEIGEPLPGVNIKVKGATIGTITDGNGNYTINVPGKETVLLYSYIGYAPKEVMVGNQTSIHIKMVEDSELIEEVVVIGYGSVKKKDVTTAVSVVTTADIDKRAITSAAQAIQGKAAGVMVTSPTGKPGETMTVRVRGATSVQAGNDPLYVVDGIPTTNLESVSPNDIESMQVLKDASSAAIYGARAANGVVLITTKKGVAGKTRVSLNIYYGFSKIGKKIDALNLEQYRALMEEMPNTGTIPESVTTNTNWNDEVFKTGHVQNYQLSVSSGTEKLTCFASGGYTDEIGIINEVTFKRYNFRSNIENQLYDWLKFGTNISYSRTEGKNQGIDNKTSSRAGVILSTINTPPYMEIWHPDNPGWYDNRTYGAQWVNPIAGIAENNMTNTNNYFIGSAYLEAMLGKHFKLRSNLGYDYKNWIGKSFLDNIATAYGRSLRGQSTDERSAETVILNENLITFDKSVDKHTISALGGYTFQNYKKEGTYIRGFDYLPIPELSTINLANQIDRLATKTTMSEWTLTSFLARIAYNFDSKYLLTVNFRADGSSKLAPGNQWGYFPSASVAWRISGEEFMSGASFVNDLKLRVGWGINGNQSGLDAYAWRERYEIKRVEPTSSNQYPGPSLVRKYLENKDLKWETTTQANIGVDATLLDQRLTFAVDAYYKKTKDLLLWVPLPSTTGIEGMDKNDGQIENVGVELLVESKNLTGNFMWNTDFNISYNKNTVKRLGLSKVYDYGQIAANEQYPVRMVEGRPLGSFYGYISEGVDPETGDMIYRNLNDNEDITVSDRTFIGNPWPDFIFGLTNSFSYKGFDLSVFLQGSAGNDLFNASRIETEGMYDFRNQSTAVLDRWVRPGQITDIPRANNHLQNNKNSSRFVENGSYLRVKTITLAYNIDAGKLNKLGISRLRPYITMNNMFTFTKYSGYDPEVNFDNSKESIVMGVDYGSYPQSKTIMIGLNLEF